MNVAARKRKRRSSELATQPRYLNVKEQLKRDTKVSQTLKRQLVERTLMRVTDSSDLHDLLIPAMLSCLSEQATREVLRLCAHANPVMAYQRFEKKIPHLLDEAIEAVNTRRRGEAEENAHIYTLAKFAMDHRIPVASNKFVQGRSMRAMITHVSRTKVLVRVGPNPEQAMVCAHGIRLRNPNDGLVLHLSPLDDLYAAFTTLLELLPTDLAILPVKWLCV